VYLLGAVTEINWILSKTDSTVLLPDLDLVIINPLGGYSYIDSPIELARFTAPRNKNSC